MNALRIFYFGGAASYRALFNWRHPAVYIPTMLVLPVLQVLFFVNLGRFNGVASDRYFVLGFAVQAPAIAGVYGMVMSLVNEREFGTLSCVLASPASRLALFCGRALPVVAHGLIGSWFVFAAGSLLLRVPVPAGALPAIGLTTVISAASVAMFGLALGAIALRTRDLWVGSNLAYSLLLLLCGATVPLSALPGWLAAIGRALPLTHGAQAARELAGGAGLLDVSGLIGQEALVGLAYAGLGYGLLRFFEAESRRRGTLESG
jgi:ABC-2 type transport system permease protein